MSSDFGKNIRCSIFGQSHSDYIGVVIDGLPAGEHIDLYNLKNFMARRAPGNTKAFGTERHETDEFKIICGLISEDTCGAPLCGIIANKEMNPEEYKKLENLPRPGHSDFTAFCKYGEAADFRGGGHFSGRLTAPLCLAGGIALQILEKRGIYIGAHALVIGNVRDKSFDPVNVTAEDLKDPGRYPFPTLHHGTGQSMEKLISITKNKGDSLGGIIEAGIIGLPVGMGAPMFDGMENIIARNVFAIPGIKGIEFGDGFEATAHKGSENNDEFISDGNKITTRTNHAGGILGGLTTGMPLILRVAVKPTPSIPKTQKTVNIKTKEEAEINIEGRHDGCIVPRAVPVVEGILALTILDMLMDGSNRCPRKENL